MKQLNFLFACSMILLLLSFVNPLKAQPFEVPVSNPFEFFAPAPNTVVSVRLVDIDNDGHLEAFVVKTPNPAFSAIVDYYEFNPMNSGVFEFIGTLPFNMPSGINFNLQFADIDGDDDYDLFYNQKAQNGHVGFAENIGSPEVPLFSDTIKIDPFGMVMPLSPADGDTIDFPYPSFGDLDADGDLDIIMNGGWINGLLDEALMYYENTGTDTDPAFGIAVLDTFGLSLPVSGVYLSNLMDLDCDGDLDMFINMGGSLNFYYSLNEDSENPAFGAFDQEPWNTDSKFVPSLGTFTDFDGDNDLDLICGGAASIYYFENLSLEPCDLIGSVTSRLEGILEIYPNPTSGQLQIVFESGNIRNEVTIEIFNLIGLLVSSSTYQMRGSSFVESLSLESSPNGIYTIRISSGEQFLSKKFAKVR